jgi:hypothetical protein
MLNHHFIGFYIDDVNLWSTCFFLLQKILQKNLPFILDTF